MKSGLKSIVILDSNVKLIICPGVQLTQADGLSGFAALLCGKPQSSRRSERKSRCGPMILAAILDRSVHMVGYHLPSFLGIMVSSCEACPSCSSCEEGFGKPVVRRFTGR
jgi:hypothetical protein